MNTPEQNPKPQGWAEVRPDRLGVYQLLKSADDKICELEAQIVELKASNEMAAEHMERGREYAARLESQLDRLKNAIRDHRSAKYEFADDKDMALYAELDALDTIKP